MSRLRILVVVAVVGVLLPVVASQSASAAPMTFMVTSTSCAGPGSITAAVEAANNNPGTDTIEFTPGLKVTVDTINCPDDRYVANVTESVIIEGNGAEVFGGITWITTGGLNTPLDSCWETAGDLLLAESPGFLQVGFFTDPPAPVEVEVSNLQLRELNAIAYFDSDQGSLLLEDVTARRILSHNRGCATPAISFRGTGADLTIRRNNWREVYNWGSILNPPLFTSHSIQGGLGAGDLTIEDSWFSRGGEHGFLQWQAPATSTVNIVSTRMEDVGGITILNQQLGTPPGPTTNIVNSVHVTGLGDDNLVDKIINAASGPMNIVASTIMMSSVDCGTDCTQINADGKVRQGPGGGPINLEQSAIGVYFPSISTGSVIAKETPADVFTADENTWIQPVAQQDAAALKALLTNQPNNLLTDPPGLPTDPVVVESSPAFVSPLVPGQLIDKIPNSACPNGVPEANALINPIDGACIDKDVFGNSRWDTGNDASNIGAVQLTLAPHLSVDATGDATVDLGWNRPLDSGDSVTGYVVRFRPAGSSGAFTEQPVTGPDSLAAQVAGLTNGTPYEFEVAAVRTTAGVGPASNLVTGTPYGPVGQPVPGVEPGKGEVTLFWPEPDTGGHPGPLFYQVVTRAAGATTWEAGPGPLSARITTIPGLTNGTTYEFGVYAFSTDGTASTLGTTTGTPVNTAPTGVDDAYTTPPGVALTVPVDGVLGNDIDPDGDALTATLGSGPSSGALLLNADGSFTYTPNAGFAGTDTFTYTPKDPFAAGSEATVTIDVIDAALDAAARFVPATPVRLFDTRPEEPGAGPKGKVAADSSIDVQIGGVGGVPDDAVAVAMNVAAVNSTEGGFVTVWPKGETQPLAATHNLTEPGQIRPNLVTVPLGDDGMVSIYTSGGAHFTGDLAGYYVDTDESTTAGRVITLDPGRVFDTRPEEPGPGPKGALGAGESIDVQVTGVAGVPDDGVAAVIMNLAGIRAVDRGFITAYPTGDEFPLAAVVNLNAPNDTNSNLVMIPVGDDGQITFFAEKGAHLSGDVTGYVTDSTAASTTAGLFVPLTPIRAFDTRPGEPGAGPKGFVGADSSIDGTIDSAVGVPSSASGAVLNVAGVQAADRGYITGHPAGTDQPLTATLNLGFTGDVRSNAAILSIGADDQISFYSEVGAHLAVDTSGYFIG